MALITKNDPIKVPTRDVGSTHAPTSTTPVVSHVEVETEKKTSSSGHGDASLFHGTSTTPVEQPSGALSSGSVPGAIHGTMATRIAQLDGKSHVEKLTSLATQATAHAVHAGKPDHPIFEAFGESLGKALGVIVTEALALIPKWNAPVLDANGKPVQSVEGADRIGKHDILMRHQEVVGPKVTALVEKLPPGVIHDLLEGVGKGATDAPGASYRLEVAIADALAKLP